MDALVAVRARIARAVLARDHEVTTLLGTVTLRPHQVEAVHRLNAALDQFGGALLADAPGLGKTFVALAVAHTRGQAVVVAPAALRNQWTDSARRAQVAVRFITLETLSRRAIGAPGARILIIDEAHHLRNSHTAWYGRAATLALGRDVLLITATPVHNRREDLETALALFLGARAGALTESDLARLIVRRPTDRSLLPPLVPIEWIRLPAAPGIATALRRLPPPLPARDGREAAALLRQGFTLAWSSSVAALGEMARRALHRAAALDDALAAGRWPTRSELRSWTIGDDASQLAFAELFDAPRDRDLSGARSQLRLHRQALDALRMACRAQDTSDAEARAVRLERLMRRHDGECVVAFSRFTATIDALWRALRLRAGVVAITARRVRSAGGGIGRRELLDLLARQTPLDAACPVRLVLATDLLGEGVDLRRASVIVHLDRPWTPALATQREGRAARLGAQHARVAVYAFRPPALVERRLAMSVRHARKEEQMRTSVASAEAREALVGLVRPWVAGPAGGDCAVAVRASITGWLTVVRDDSGAVHLLTAVRGSAPREDDALAVSLLREASGAVVPLRADAARAIRRAVREWMSRHRSAAFAGVSSGDGLRRLLALLDRGLGTAPLHERAALQRRAARLRSMLAGCHGAGMERLLASAPTDCSVVALLDWLEINVAPAARDDAGSRRPRRARVLALLILE